MHLIISKILGLAMTTILTAYILALTMSNQAFAQDQIPFAGSSGGFGSSGGGSGSVIPLAGVGGGGANFVGSGAILGNDVRHTPLPVIIKRIQINHDRNPPHVRQGIKLLLVGVAFALLPYLGQIIAKAIFGQQNNIPPVDHSLLPFIGSKATLGQPASNSQTRQTTVADGSTGQFGQILVGKILGRHPMVDDKTEPFSGVSPILYGPNSGKILANGQSQHHGPQTGHRLGGAVGTEFFTPNGFFFSPASNSGHVGQTGLQGGMHSCHVDKGVCRPF